MNPKHRHKIRTLALCLAALPAAAFAEDGNTATELENITVTAKNRSLKTATATAWARCAPPQAWCFRRAKFRNR